MKLAIDSWAPEYGTAIGGPQGLQPTDGAVDVGLEVAAQDWSPRRPGPDVQPATDIRFIDGVRRIDARVWAIDGTASRPAIAVSYAAGIVHTNGSAAVTECEVRRELFGPAGMPGLVGGSVTYHPYAVAGGGDEDLIAAVQRRMGQLEVEVAARAGGGDLIVVDGPLSGRQQIPGAVGYVKTHRTAYLPPLVEHVVAELPPGCRTPLFATQTSWSRFSWYLRLPNATGHPWAGVVRLEAPADMPLAEVVALADTTAATLPRFASHPHRDPRAPQNLYPIAGLERQLTRRLGDRHHLERVLRRAAPLAS